ncbi:interleukin-8-like [Mustelus asterias]
MNRKVTLIILILLALYMASTQAASVGRTGMNLRCQCIKTLSKIINPKHLKDIQILESSPHCPKRQIIVTVQDKKVCLNPNQPWVKKVL